METGSRLRSAVGSSSITSSYCVDATHADLTNPQAGGGWFDKRSLRRRRSRYASVTADGGAAAGGVLNGNGNIGNVLRRGTPTGNSGGDAAALNPSSIWETLYDGTPDLDGSSFQLVNNPAYSGYGAIKAKATSDLASLYSNPLPGGGTTFFTSNATFLDTQVGQDQVTGSPGAPSPRR